MEAGPESAESGPIANPAVEEPRPSAPVPEALAAVSALAAGANAPIRETQADERAEIERLAYSYWEARGCQGGSPEEDWLRAEREIRQRSFQTTY